MSATERAVANASGCDMFVTLDSAVGAPVSVVVVTRLPQFKPPRLAAVPTIQVRHICVLPLSHQKLLHVRQLDCAGPNGLAPQSFAYMDGSLG